MIIIPNYADKQAEVPKVLGEEQLPHDPPPTYTYVQSHSVSPPPPDPSRSSPSYRPVDVGNFISISREHAHIKKALTVDPSLYIPESLRTPLRLGESERSRKNVRLETVHGYIEAEIVLLQDMVHMETRSLQRATLQLSSSHGGIKVTIPDHPYRPPFQLTAKSTNGCIRLTLPRSFTGPITVSYVHGEVNVSALGGRFTTISEANGKMKGFIGDLSQSTECYREGMRWKGDELLLDLTHGSVKLRFDHDRARGDSARSF